MGKPFNVIAPAIAAVLLYFQCHQIKAETISPIIISNFNPLTAVHGLPYINTAKVLDDGGTRFTLMYDVSSHYGSDGNNSERVLLDGESYRTTLIYDRNVNKNLQFSVVIPYITHKAGTLDSFIDSWHGLFGLPEGGRDIAENDQFRYAYIKDGEFQFDLKQSVSGLGDIRLETMWQLGASRSPNDYSAISASLKLPSGDSGKFLGSGAADLALWYKRQFSQNFWGLQGGVFYSGGALVLGNGDILPDQVNRLAGFGGIGAGIFLTNSFIFITQLDINSPMYSSSDLPETGDFAAQLTLGGTIKVSDAFRINFGVGEDLIIDASPDVTFHVDIQAQL